VVIPERVGLPLIAGGVGVPELRVEVDVEIEARHGDVEPPVPRRCPQRNVHLYALTRCNTQQLRDL